LFPGVGNGGAPSALCSVDRRAGGRLVAGGERVEIRSWTPPRPPSTDLVLVRTRFDPREDGQADPAVMALARVDATGMRDGTADAALAQREARRPGHVRRERTGVRAVDPPVARVARRGIYALELEGQDARRAG
jgi:hypothetical protein